MANRQEIVCNYIDSNYVQFRRLRRDVISNKVQVNEEQLLSVYFDIPAAGYGSFMTTAEISDKLVTMGSIKKPMSMSRLGMVLQQAGFQSKRVGKSRIRGWLVRVRDTDEVNANRNIEGKG